MTDLSIRRIIINEISVAKNYAYQAKKNKDANAVTYFHGYAYGLRNALAQLNLCRTKKLKKWRKKKMTNDEFKQILREEIEYCATQLVDCDDRDYDFYSGAQQALMFVMNRVKSIEEIE